MVDSLFLQISFLFIICILVGGVMRLLRQPLLISYILVGLLVNSYFLNIVPETSFITTFAQMGEVLLLFMVGLNLNPKIIKDLGKVSLITGIGQVLFTSLVGLAISLLLGFSLITSLYVVVALAFSSTIIITKLLSDKGDMETLYGRISIGFLIVQDLIAILVLMAVSSFSQGNVLSEVFFTTILKGLGLLLILFVVGWLVLPKLTKYIAKSQEFLLLFSVGWCFALAALFFKVNFSLEIGALLAGISLSTSIYRYEISSKLRPLRDFFVIMFFILLGSQMTFTHFQNYIVPIIIFSLFILLGNPLIVMILMGFLGYTKRTGFLAGLTVAQVSEFSFILIALGVKVGHLNNEILSMVTIIGLITIAGSTYFIMYSNKIYSWLSPYLSIFERKGHKIDEHTKLSKINYDVLLFGYNRIGYSLVESLKKIKKKFLVIDYNPEIIIELNKQNIPCQYGDAEDIELLHELNFNHTRMIISTIPDVETNLVLIKTALHKNKHLVIIVVSHQIEDALRLYKAGATYVTMPHFLGGQHTALMIEQHGLDLRKFLQEQKKHKEHLLKRKELGHEHPK